MNPHEFQEQNSGLGRNIHGHFPLEVSGGGVVNIPDGFPDETCSRAADCGNGKRESGISEWTGVGQVESKTAKNDRFLGSRRKGSIQHRNVHGGGLFESSPLSNLGRPPVASILTRIGGGKAAMRGLAIILLLASLLMPVGVAAGEILRIDLSQPRPAVIKGHLGLGTTRNPDGRTIDADSRSLTLDGKPWTPVSGEFHFSRYPRTEWRDELLKMKAGGLDIVATYVFWIYHEERPGEWDWSGQRSLRDFVAICREVGLKVIVRLGPWSHGEVRNGGFPDWVQSRAPHKRRNRDPDFMALTGRLYARIAEQLAGQLWKDGGPVIGVQLDNECEDIPYLFALKRLARKHGFDVPFYTMTGWNGVAAPKRGLMPLFEAYADGYWTDDETKYKAQYFFSPSPIAGDIAAPGRFYKETMEQISRSLARFPYACCEMAGGMASAYDRRVAATPADCAAIATVKLGCGNNLPGYYMYHGGINPDGKYSILNEGSGVDDYYQLPVKDYDYMAPLGACGQVREHYHSLRMLHMFLKDWGADLALMPPFFPHNQPGHPNDTQTLRWCVRSNGSSGFLFFNNHLRFERMPPKEGVQFALNLKGGECLLPSAPITIPSGAYGMWPVHMDCAGVDLVYATAQPLCRLDDEAAHWFFFSAIDGIEPEFMIGGKEAPERIQNITPGKRIAFSRVAPDQSTVHFVVLPPDRARRLWKIPVAGRMRAVLSEGALLPDGDSRLRVETLGSASASVAVLPPVRSALWDGAKASAVQDGVFQSFMAPNPPLPVIDVGVEAIRPPREQALDKLPDPVREKSWESAGVWRLRLPADPSSQNRLLRIRYSGDVARVYAAGKLVTDQFYNGTPLDVALWRLPPGPWAGPEIHILPPARFVGASLMPRTRWTLDWEDGPQ